MFCAACQAVLALDLSGLNHILAQDRLSGLVDVEAGIGGTELERQLKAQGMTLGTAFESSLGGWIARAETMPAAVQSVTVATPQGVLHLGKGLHHLMAGSRGSLGVITSAKLQIRPCPRAKIVTPISFPISPRASPFCVKPPAPALPMAACFCRTMARPALSAPCTGAPGICRQGLARCLACPARVRRRCGAAGDQLFRQRKAEKARAPGIRGAGEKAGRARAWPGNATSALSPRCPAGSRRGDRQAAIFRQLVGAAAALCAAPGGAEAGDARPCARDGRARAGAGRCQRCARRRRFADGDMALSQKAGRRSRPGRRHSPGSAGGSGDERPAGADARNTGRGQAHDRSQGYSGARRFRRRPGPP